MRPQNKRSTNFRKWTAELSEDEPESTQPADEAASHVSTVEPSLLTVDLIASDSAAFSLE
jgi:hypothetical protein